MICPYCGHLETKVIDSRDTNDGKAIRRRRECEKCQKRFSTYEEPEIMKLTVIKKDGSREEFQKEKIKKGIARALEKRPVNAEKREKLLREIEYEICSLGKTELSTREIGRIILKKLRQIDEVAYVRFASVYKSFGSIKAFRKELEKMEKKNG